MERQLPLREGSGSSGLRQRWARSGIWLAKGTGRLIACAPSRTVSRSIQAASEVPCSSAALSISPCARREARPSLRAAHLDPEAGVDVVEPCANSRSICAGSRVAAAISRRRTTTSLSTRHSPSSSRRAPCPCPSSSRAMSCARSATTWSSSWRWRIGSISRRWTSGTCCAMTGSSGSGTRPSSWSRRISGLAAGDLRLRNRRWSASRPIVVISPSRFSPRRRSTVTSWSSRGAATGRSDNARSISSWCSTIVPSGA